MPKSLHYDKQLVLTGKLISLVYHKEKKAYTKYQVRIIMGTTSYSVHT